MCRCEGGLFGEMLTVAPGSVGGGGVTVLASEKGKKGGESSSSSSSASERGLSGAFDDE